MKQRGKFKNEKRKEHLTDIFKFIILFQKLWINYKQMFQVLTELLEEDSILILSLKGRNIIGFIYLKILRISEKSRTTISEK